MLRNRTSSGEHGRCGPPSAGFSANSGSSPVAPASEKCVIRPLPSRPLELARPLASCSRGRVEQDPHRLLGLRAERDDAPEDLLRLPRLTIDVEDAARAASGRIDENLVGHRAGDQRAAARRHRVGHRRERGAEVRVGHAAVLARAAVVARLPPVERPGQIRRATLRERATELLLEARPEGGLGAGERHRRLEAAVGQFREALGQPVDADVVLDQIVVRRDIGVADRPVYAGAVVGGRLEVDVAEPQAGATPDVRAPAHQPRAYPQERGVGRVDVRLFEVVDEPVGVPLAHGVRARLDWTLTLERPLGSPPVRQAVRGHMLLVVGVGELPARLEHGHAQPRLGEALGGPST